MDSGDPKETRILSWMLEKTFSKGNRQLPYVFYGIRVGFGKHSKIAQFKGGGK